MDGFDFSELTDFKKELMGEIVENLPKDAQKFLDKEKRKFLKEVKKTAKTNVGKKTGNYYKSLKSGKTRYNKDSKEVYTKVYADEKMAPHAHLIEDGHINVARGESKNKIGRKSGKGGKEIGFTPGKFIFKKSEMSFQSTYESDTTDFLEGYFKDNLK